MLRKRRNPTPGFNLPTPFQPITGERAPLIQEGVSPHCAMMQVAAEDIYDDYVICRGYDPRDKRFYEYDASNPLQPGIPVAKPYGTRVAQTYRVGQVFPAVIPLTRIGQTAGVAETTQGHPADLSETIEILYTEDGKPISWLILDFREEGIPFYNASGETIPAYAAMVQRMVSADANDYCTPELLHVTKVGLTTSYATVHHGPYYINTGTDVASEDYGICWPANATPREVLVDPTATGTTWSDFVDYFSGDRYGGFSGQQWGIISGTWKLGRGLPGFQLVHTPNETSTTVYATTAAVPAFWGKAVENWRYYTAASTSKREYHVRVNPFVYMSSIIWDGTGTPAEIETIVLLPVAGAQMPNVDEGDILLCQATPAVGDGEWSGIRFCRWVATGEYADDPIGTVKFTSDYSSIPQGWAIMDGTNNAAGNGGSGIDATGYIIKGTDTTPSTGSFNQGSGAAVDWVGLTPIERLDNSDGADNGGYPWSP